MINPDLLRQELQEKISLVSSLEELNQLKASVLGRKGQLTQYLRSLGELPLEQRKILGAQLNSLKVELESFFLARERELEEAMIREKLEKGRVDVTLPGIRPPLGRRHPLLQVWEEIEDAFLSLGFDIYEGPEVEWEYYNFGALNIPPDHPARDMWDTFYITDKMLLRTHTSPDQIRCMEEQRPPIKAIMPGLVYRHEAVDATHMDVFVQIEGLVVDKDTTFADLKGTLELFVSLIFGPGRKMMFVPSYFPFTEPSAELLILWDDEKGHNAAGGKWLEVLGCGQVHPQVLRNVGLDPQVYSGFAFGLGVERIAMLKYNIPEIRLFMENDLRFLEQFG
ncbi:MAG: phenylalanine--tRNA ligase subunit alpha [bacterium]